jgi:hypothetical protein
MRTSFHRFDVDRSGSLSLQQVQKAVTEAGYQLDQHAFFATCKAFDPDMDGNLGELEFIALTLFLQSCKGIYNVFDPQGSNSVNFNFSQFVYAVANTR